jgi:hypothetical protein
MVASTNAKLNLDSPDTNGAVDADTERVRRAIRMAVRVLSERPEGEEVARLLDQAQRLMTQTESWGSTPPSPDVRDEVTRNVMSIHLSALRAARGR